MADAPGGRRLRILLLSGPPITGGLYGDYQAAAPRMQPYGLLCLAAVLEAAGYRDVQLIDALGLGLSEKVTLRRVADFSPHLIGITTYSNTVGQTRRLAAALRRCCPGSVLVAGGPHATLRPEDFLADGLFNYCCCGEGEEAFLDLVRCVERGDDPGGIANLARRNDGRIVCNPLRPLREDLDTLPFPAMHLLGETLGAYYPQPLTYRRRPFATVVSSRGCPYGCRFCGSNLIWTRSYRAHSAEYLIRLCRHLVDTFGVREISFFDDVFNLDRERVLEFCARLAAERLPLRWSASISLNTVDSTVATALRRGGCWLVSGGIESGNETVMATLGKPLTVAEAETKVAMLARAGLRVRGYFMLGLPADTAATIGETIAFSRRLPLYAANFTIFVPHPGSEFYRRLTAESAPVTPIDTYVSERTELPYAPPGLSGRMLLEYQRRAFLAFYLRPRLWLRYLHTLTGVEDVRRFLIMTRAAAGLLRRVLFRSRRATA